MHDGGLQLRTHWTYNLCTLVWFYVPTSLFELQSLTEYVFWQIELLKYFEMVNYMETFGSNITHSDKPNYS